MPALSLSKLVDLALGTPEVGAVNFNILHSLLHAMIQHLKISDITADINESDRDFLSGPEKMRLLSSLSGDSGREDSQDHQSDKSGFDIRKHRPPYHQLETKVARLAEQLEQLNALPSTSELFQQIKATGDSDRPKPMADLWKTMQMSKRVGANEEGVGKLMSMVEDLMREMSALKDGYSRMDDLEAQMRKLMEENNSLKEKIDNLGVEDLLNKLNDLDAFTKELNHKFELLPSAEDFLSFVTWPALEDALNGVRLDMAELSRKAPTPTVPSQTEVGSRPGSSRPSTRLSSASSGPSSQMLDILEKLGKVCGEHEILEKRVDVLEDEMKKKVDQDFLQSSLEGMNLHLLDDLTKQLEQIKTDVANLQNEMQSNREQVAPVPMKPLGVVFDPIHGVNSVHEIATPSRKGSAMLPPLSSPVSRESLIPGSPGVGVFGKRVADIEEKLKLLEEYVFGDDFQETVEDACSEMILQVAVEEPLQPSVAKTKQAEPADDVEVHDSQGILAVCECPEEEDKLLNLAKLLNKELHSLKEKLHERDEDFKKMEKDLEIILKKGLRSGASRMDTTDGDGADMEALMRAQQSIHKLREDVDKLQITTQDIITENDTRTRQIESLFQYCDKLQDVKADKEYVAMEVDVKADKRQLEGKVNHSLFESTTEDINRLIQEIQDKLNGNEFGWKDAITKLTSELESKLDRMELKSLKEWMESRLKALNQKIKESSGWEDDDAAGIRKQLLQRFHCISCDRPVDIMAGGPIPSIPANNGLPATRSPRPYTTYELDQIRQHAKSLQGGGNVISSVPYTVRQTREPSYGDRPMSAGHVIGRNAGNYERALAQREVARMRKTDLRRYMIQQYQANTEACRGDVETSTQEATDFYAPDRPCGGSHTLTYPHKRVTKMSHLNHMFQNEPVIPAPAPVAFKHDSELDILGVDGHIYKGRVKKGDPSRRHPLMATYQTITAEDRIPVRTSNSAGAAKPTTTPIPPSTRPRPTSAVPRPASGGSVTRINSSARLTMRPQSAHASSGSGSDVPSGHPEEPREFLPAVEAQDQVEPGQITIPEPVEVPGETPRDDSATD